MTHPLDGAYARLDRALEHIAEPRTIIGEFIDHEYEIAEGTAQIKPQPNVPIQITRPESPIPIKVPILVGETVNNLRTTLDYVVYELAILDSGSIQNGTQFPIEDTADGFQARKKSYLKGLNPSHVAQIERLQPYNGIDWMRLLRTVSNPDKHRHLTMQTHNSGVSATHGKNPEQVFAEPGVKGLFVDIVAPNPDLFHPVFMQFHITFFIAFDNGFNLIDTLEQIRAEVANTLKNFKADF